MRNRSDSGVLMEEVKSFSLKKSLVESELPKSEQEAAASPPKTPSVTPPSTPTPTPPQIPHPTKFHDFDEPFTFTWQDFYRRKLYISGAWDLEYYYTIRGCENFHIYLWIAKDLAWTQNWYWPAMLFGSAALLWCVVLAYHAFESKIFEEVYALIGLILWLSANFVWMAGTKL